MFKERRKFHFKKFSSLLEPMSSVSILRPYRKSSMKRLKDGVVSVLS